MRMTHLIPTGGLALAAMLAACGGSGSPPPLPTGGGPPPSSATATPVPAPAAKPEVKTIVDTRAGRSPLRVSFGLCDSRDGNGGTALDYYASFEGEPLAK